MSAHQVNSDEEGSSSHVDLKLSPAEEASLAAFEESMSQNDFNSRANMLVEKCGVFGCIANGDWPTNLGVASIVGLGLVGLQHRYVHHVLLTSSR